MLRQMTGQSQTTDILARSLDARMARNRVIANNIANVSTPGFERREVHFEDSLAKALNKKRVDGNRTSDKHLPVGRNRPEDIRYSVKRAADHSSPSGVNNVDIDREMALLAENQIGYKYSIRLLGDYYKRLNSAIKGRSIQ